jgi:beta-lactamase class A
MCVFAVVAQAAYQRTDKLQSELDRIAQQYAAKGKIAIFAKDLKTGASVGVNPDEVVQTASVIKLAMLVEAFDEVAHGKLNLSDKITLTKENQVPGSGILSFLQPGLQPTVEDALVLMVDLSDNTATNLMIDKVPLANVNAKLAKLGLKNTYFYKKVFKPATGPVPPDQPKYGLGKTTPREMAALMESIDRCEIGKADLCNRMLQILKDQQDRDDIPRYIETVDTSEKPSAIANKTGALDDVRNDVGIVYAEHGPIVISAFTYDNKDQRWSCDNAGQEVIGRMAEAILNSWAPRSSKAASGQ